jgi:hypothetical protein
MFAVDDGLINGNLDFADVLFIVAAILFVLYAFMGFADAVKPQIHNVLLGLGLACVAVGLLVW